MVEVPPNAKKKGAQHVNLQKELKLGLSGH